MYCAAKLKGPELTGLPNSHVPVRCLFRHLSSRKRHWLVVLKRERNALIERGRQEPLGLPGVKELR